MFFNRKKTDKKAELATKIQLLEADIREESNVLRGLENKLQHERVGLTLLEIESMRLELQKIKLDIINKRDELGNLNEMLEQ